MENISATTARSTASSAKISANAEKWAAGRGISRQTLEQMPVASGTAFFPDIGRKTQAIFFKYQDGWKARSIEDKAFVAGGGFKLSFWNLEHVLRAGPKRVYVTEGEMDALALVEGGVPPECVLSVPNGARAKPADDPKELRGYDYVEQALTAGLSKVKEFVWVGDGDAPGKVLREDMVRIIGAARFYFFEWPDGVNDANGMLIENGAAPLADLVQNGVQPWPISGIFRLSELPEPPPMQVWDLGIPEWESRVKLAARSMSVVTGHPGHGKTALFTQLWFRVVRDYGVPIAIASFETRPRPHIRRVLRTMYLDKLEKDMDEEDKKFADRWIDMRYFFLQPTGNTRPTLRWWLDCMEAVIVRYGVRIGILDPWNRMEDDRHAGENETDYIGRCLREIYSFAQDMNCHIQIMAHPSKSDGAQRNAPPQLQDISGSKHWDNVVDQGFVVHRPKMAEGMDRVTDAVLYHRKARFEELGYPCKLLLRYDLAKGHFVPTDYEVDAPAPKRKTKAG